MGHEIERDAGGIGILDNKLLWICIGAGIFILIGFILPTPQSVGDTVEKYGFAEKLIAWEVAHNPVDAGHKMMIVLGIIPMAVIFFATEAIPIGLTGIMMPMLDYFLHLLPRNMIGKTFAGDAPMFLLGVLAMGVAVVDVGLHKRLAGWLLGWTKGFMYCGALTLGALLKESGAALWLARSFLKILDLVNMSSGFGLWVGLSGLSGLICRMPEQQHYWVLSRSPWES